MIVVGPFPFSRSRLNGDCSWPVLICQDKMKWWLRLICFHFPGQDETMIAVGLGYSCHLTIKMSQILGLPLRHPMENRSSRSVIYDQVHSKLADKDREWVAPPALFLSLSTTTFVMALTSNWRLPGSYWPLNCSCEQPHNNCSCGLPHYNCSCEPPRNNGELSWKMWVAYLVSVVCRLSCLHDRLVSKFCLLHCNKIVLLSRQSCI